MYKIAIVDDNSFDLKELSNAAKAIDVASVIFSANNAIALFKWLRKTSTVPNIILLDIIMDRMDGVITTLVLKRQFPSVKVIAVSVTRKEELIKQMYEAGALAFISKNDFSIAVLKETIEKVAITQQGSAIVAADFFKHKNKYKLTSREIEYLTWLGNILSDVEIAELMGVGYKSVENYARAIKEKTGIAGKRDLIRWSMQQGFSKIAIYEDLY